jgi:eukaryotic-like serine/threonine-protein kinase
VSLRFRTQLTRWLDRRFFREAYDRERILLALIQDVDQLDSVSSVSKVVSHELEAAFHPQCLSMWYRDVNTPRLAWYSSGEDGRAVAALSPESPLVRLAERGEVIELPTTTVDGLPQADRDWLSDAGVRLIVPMIASSRHMLGLLLLGDKRSDEPYSFDDVKLLQAIAQQIATAREHVLLKEREDDDRRVRHQVLARLESGHVNLLKECPACGACYDAVVATCATDGAELRLSLPVDRTVDGKYRLDRLIGKGGMGAVYEAAGLRLARSVAVKIMLGRAFGDHQALRRFEREAQATARLAHPNIVTVFDFGALGAEGAFIVMELVRGRTLRAELQQRGRIAPQDAAIWFEHICAGVAAAHHQGIIHRDLKPENVLITRADIGGDLAKVLDFGLAKIRPSETDETFEPTSAGVVLGTTAYMAPEQLSGDAVDERGDIFALGVMVAEAIVGTRPFKGRTPTELLMATMRDPLTLDGEGWELRSLEAALRRATAKDPSARYRSVTEFAHDVIPALRSMSVPRENLRW